MLGIHVPRCDHARERIDRAAAGFEASNANLRRAALDVVSRSMDPTGDTELTDDRIGAALADVRRKYLRAHGRIP